MDNIPGAVNLRKTTVLHETRTFKNYHLWEVEHSDGFISSMKYVIMDYYQNCLVELPYNFGDERTFFCEVVIPVLKTFAIHNKNMKLHGVRSTQQKTQSPGCKVVTTTPRIPKED